MNHTLMLIKPNATEKHKIGEILKIVEDDGFIIERMRMIRMTKEFAETFYSVHRGKPFFERLIKFMTSGKTVAVVLGRENAVTELRRIVGATDPAKAETGTIRALYGETVTFNAVHASDSIEHGMDEIQILFPGYPALSI